MKIRRMSASSLDALKEEIDFYSAQIIVRKQQNNRTDKFSFINSIFLKFPMLNVMILLKNSLLRLYNMTKNNIRTLHKVQYILEGDIKTKKQNYTKNLDIRKEITA